LTVSDHPIPEVRDALSTPFIEPVGKGEEGTNPTDKPDQIHLITNKYTPIQEVSAVVDSIENWLPEHPEETVAILVPRNTRGFAVIDELKQRGSLGNLLAYLANPDDPKRLSSAYKVWRRQDREDPSVWTKVQELASLIRKCRHVEDFIWPRPNRDWLYEVQIEQEEPQAYQQLLEFRELIRYWQSAILLPIDQLILTLAQDIFTDAHELAITHKLAILLRQANETHENWKLPEFTEELAVIARNERRFLGFGEEDTGFDPDKYRGKVIVATMSIDIGIGCT